MEVEIGRIYTAKAAFLREEGCEFAPFDYGSWTPGFRNEFICPDDSVAVCDAFGEVHYFVIDVHKLPKPYPARVFYVRKFKDPDGKWFGNGKLRICTVQAFVRKATAPIWPYSENGIELAVNE